MQMLTAILGAIVAIVTLLGIFAGIIIWIIRLEGKLNTAAAVIVEREKLHAQTVANFEKRHSENVTHLKNADDMLLQLCNDFRSNTELKLDNLSKDMKESFRTIFDKLDGKADKV